MKASFVKHIAFLLLIFSGYFQYNLLMNRHVHLYNGHIICHAHPFHPNASDKGPVTSHSHSVLVFFLLDQIANITTLLVAISGFSMIFLLLLGIILTLYSGKTLSLGFNFIHTIRPPPCPFNC